MDNITKEEYKKQLAELEARHKKERHAVISAFALSQNTHNIGDIIKDHTDTIKIDKILPSLTLGGYPECVYYGPLLKKDGTPKKNGNRGSIYQSCIQS